MTPETATPTPTNSTTTGSNTTGSTATNASASRPDNVSELRRDFSAEREDRAEELIGEFLPEGFDWERIVRAYPLPAMAAAALGGFLLGKNRGFTIVGALAGFAARQVTTSLNDILGEDVLEPEL